MWRGESRGSEATTTAERGTSGRGKFSPLPGQLSKKDTGSTLYILDEPTTGLHSSDIKKLLEVIQQLIDNGNSMVIIEHNMDVIKTADYIIDIGLFRLPHPSILTTFTKTQPCRGVERLLLIILSQNIMSRLQESNIYRLTVLHAEKSIAHGCHALQQRNSFFTLVFNELLIR